MSEKITILGLGNVLLKDEGLGVHVVEHLKQQSLPDNVELIDGGTAGLDVLSSIENSRMLIIIDTIKTGAAAGTIYRLGAQELDELLPQMMLSLHQIGFAQIMKIGR